MISFINLIFNLLPEIPNNSMPFLAFLFQAGLRRDPCHPGLGWKSVVLSFAAEVRRCFANKFGKFQESRSMRVFPKIGV